MGKVISEIQKSKNIKIKDICDNLCSESTYFRIINGEVDVSFNILNHIIKKLNISFEELFILVEGDNIIQKDMNIIRELFLTNNINALKNIKAELVDKNLIHLCSLLMDRLSGEESSNKNELILYLLSIESWTRYELILFNNSLFAFNHEITNILINKILNSYYDKKTYPINKSELFQMCVNVIVIYLQNEYIDDSYKLYKRLRQFKLDEEQLLEKNILLYLSGLFDLIYDEKNVQFNKKIDTALEIFLILGSNNMYEMHKDLLQYIINKQ